MIITFYDRNFIALQNNASLNVGEWNLIRKAVDFDDFSCVSEAFNESVNPTFVIMCDDYGRYKYGAFAGIPQLNEDNKSEIQASDLKTIFNNEILIKFNSYTTLVEYFTAVINALNTQSVQGSFNINLVMTDISNMPLGDLTPNTEEMQVYNVWEDLIEPFLKYYDLYMTSRIDLSNQKLVFTISKINKYTKPMRIYEMQTKGYGKQVASINECQTIVDDGTNLTYSNKFILCSDNSITTNTFHRDLFPIKNRIVYKTTTDTSEVNRLLVEGVEECLKTLIELKYNESFEVDVTNEDYFIDEFDTNYQVYLKRGELYKTLPIGQIQEDHTGKKTIVIGYKNNDVVLYIKE